MLDYISTADGTCSSIPLCVGFYSNYERLCTSLKTQFINIKVNKNNNNIKLLLFQCIAIACKMISLLGYYYSKGKLIIPNEMNMKKLISILNILSSCITSIQKIYKEESYAVTMLFWSACDALSCITDIVQLSKKPGKKQEQHHYESNHGNKSSYSKTLDLSILQSLLSTCPSPQALEDELLRLQYQRLMDENKPNLAASSETEKGSSTSTKNDNTNDFSCSFSFYRLQYILEGLQRLLRAGVLTVGRRYASIVIVIYYMFKILILFCSIIHYMCIIFTLFYIIIIYVCILSNV